MNNRIQELAEQCYHPYSEHNINLEKFAELIVRECAYIAEGYYGFKKHGPGIAIAEEIKQHFGVEE